MIRWLNGWRGRRRQRRRFLAEARSHMREINLSFEAEGPDSQVEMAVLELGVLMLYTAATAQKLRTTMEMHPIVPQAPAGARVH